MCASMRRHTLCSLVARVHTCERPICYVEIIYLSLGLDGINSDQALFGQLSASNHTRAVRGSASWSKADARRALSAMLTVSRGLDILDAEANPLLTEQIGRASWRERGGQ